MCLQMLGVIEAKCEFEWMDESRANQSFTLNARDCSILNLLDFVTRYAGVEYEFRGARIVIMTPGGEILLGEQNGEQANAAYRR